MEHGRTRKDADESAKSLIFISNSPVKRKHRRSFLFVLLNFAVGLLLLACRPPGSTAPHILYLGWDEVGVVQLWRVEADGTGAVALTAVSTDLFDFAPAPTAKPSPGRS